MMETTESSSPSKEPIYDEIRKAWVSSTPEEIVRQKLIHKMISELSYPRELLSVERSLSDLCGLGASRNIPNRRVDITSFLKVSTKLLPLLIIECKESKVYVKDALAQVQGYNHFIKAPFMAVAHPEGVLFGYFMKGSFISLPYLPSYEELLKVVKCE